MDPTTGKVKATYHAVVVPHLHDPIPGRETVCLYRGQWKFLGSYNLNSNAEPRLPLPSEDLQTAQTSADEASTEDERPALKKVVAAENEKKSFLPEKIRGISLALVGGEQAQAVEDAAGAGRSSKAQRNEVLLQLQMILGDAREPEEQAGSAGANMQDNEAGRSFRLRRVSFRLGGKDDRAPSITAGDDVWLPADEQGETGSQDRDKWIWRFVSRRRQTWQTVGSSEAASYPVDTGSARTLLTRGSSVYSFSPQNEPHRITKLHDFGTSHHIVAMAHLGVRERYAVLLTSGKIRFRVVTVVVRNSELWVTASAAGFDGHANAVRYVATISPVQPRKQALVPSAEKQTGGNLNLGNPQAADLQEDHFAVLLGQAVKRAGGDSVSEVGAPPPLLCRWRVLVFDAGSAWRLENRGELHLSSEHSVRVPVVGRPVVVAMAERSGPPRSSAKLYGHFLAARVLQVVAQRNYDHFERAAGATEEPEVHFWRLQYLETSRPRSFFGGAEVEQVGEGLDLPTAAGDVDPAAAPSTLATTAFHEYHPFLNFFFYEYDAEFLSLLLMLVVTYCYYKGWVLPQQLAEERKKVLVDPEVWKDAIWYNDPVKFRGLYDAILTGAKNSQEQERPAGIIS